MTSNRNYFHISLLLPVFQLFLAFQILIVPLAARNIKSSGVNKSNQSEILVIMAGGINVTSIYNGFSEYKKIFADEFPDDRRIIFKTGEDMRSLIQQLESTKYSTIVYVFSNNSSDKNKSQVKVVDGHLNGEFFGYCDVISSEFSALYSKNIIFWPCPKMKKTEKFLTSYETVSFAVKSVFDEFNWTEAIILATGEGSDEQFENLSCM